MNADWDIQFKADETNDNALRIIEHAMNFMQTGKDMFFCRIALHEAIVNAVEHGESDIYVRAFGNESEMQVEIMQQNEIIFPDKTESYKGTSLIRRYAQDVSFSQDKKTLILRFY